MMDVTLLSPHEPHPHRATGVHQTDARLAESLARLHGDRLTRFVPMAGRTVGCGPSCTGFGFRLWQRLPLSSPRGSTVHSTHFSSVHARTNTLTVHDLFWDAHPETYGVRERQRRARHALLHRMSTIITPSEVVREQVIDRGVAPERVEAVPWGISREVFHPEGVKSTPFGTPHILTVGAMNPRKRLLDVADAMEHIDRPWVHAGPAPDSPQARRILEGMQERAGDCLLHVVHPDGADLAALFRGAACLVYPSQDEGFGLPPLEAAACGVPSVVSDAPIFQETLGGHACVERNDLKKAIERRLDMVPDRDALVAHSDHYTWRRCGEAHSRLYAQ